MEAELELEDPTDMGNDVSSSENGGGRSVVMTLMEHREPTTTSASGGWDAERHGDVPTQRNR